MYGRFGCGRTLNQLGIAAAEQNLFSDMISSLKIGLKSKEIISAVVFGSMSRGEEKAGSDLDLFVVSDNHDKAIETVSVVAEDTFLKFHRKISHIVFTRKQIKSKRNSGLVRSILKDHILVTGMGLAGVIR